MEKIPNNVKKALKEMHALGKRKHAAIRHVNYYMAGRTDMCVYGYLVTLGQDGSRNCLMDIYVGNGEIDGLIERFGREIVKCQVPSSVEYSLRDIYETAHRQLEPGLVIEDYLFNYMMIPMEVFMSQSDDECGDNCFISIVTGEGDIKDLLISVERTVNKMKSDIRADMNLAECDDDDLPF